MSDLRMMRDRSLNSQGRLKGFLPGSLFLLALLAAGLPSRPAPAGGDTLEVTPAKPRQGEALFVRLREAQPGEPRAAWLGKSYPLRRVGDAWAAVLPISPDTQAGGHTVAVTFSRSASRERLARVVDVERVTFPVQRLSMQRSRASLYNYPGVQEREERPLSAAIRTQTDERFWNGDWILPVRGRLSTPFGVRRIRNGRAVGRHRGTDI